MGEVYRAKHLKLGREVAIKVLPDEVASDSRNWDIHVIDATGGSTRSHAGRELPLTR